MPNLAWVISRGVSGKLRTVSAPNCPKVYSIFETSRPPEENGITGFKVNGETAVSSLLKAPPLWSLLSNAGISVGMANVPATFPAPPVNGYLITGMLTHGEVTVAVANDKKPRRQDSRVPAVYLASAFVWIIPVLEFCKISNLRRINPPEGFVPTLLLAGASGIRAKTTIGRRHLLALARSRPSRSRQTQVRER